MIEPTGKLVCRKTDFGPVCEWQGGKFTHIDAETIHHALGGEFAKRIEPGTVFTFGRVRLRVISRAFAGSCSIYSDYWLVMLESPHAQLYWLYREKAEKLLRFVFRCELAVRAFRLQLREGQLMPFTSRLADRLL